MNNWQDFIYPLGFIAQIAFALRVITQWLESEAAKKSTVSRSFWNLSLIGSILMLLHTYVQSQYNVCVVQACNGIIAWRNLNLMGPQEKQVKFSTIVYTLIAGIVFVTGAFLAQAYYLYDGHFVFQRTPTHFLNSQQDPLSLAWHIIGTLGIVLFASRFWVQWWYSEKHKKSELGTQFWWLSLVGALLASAYFIRMHDIVNLIGPSLGIIPYIRNLMLLNNTKPKNKLATQEDKHIQ